MGTSTSGHRLYWKLAIGLVAAAGAYGWYSLRTARPAERCQPAPARERRDRTETQHRECRRDDQTVQAEAGRDGQALCQFDDDQPHLALVSRSDCEHYTGLLTDVALTATSPIEIVARTTQGKPRQISSAF